MPPRAKTERGEAIMRIWKGSVALEHLSPELRADPQVVLAAVQRCEAALPYASEALQTDRAFILKAAKHNGQILEVVLPEFRMDKEIVMEAVRSKGLALRHAPQDMQADREIVTAAARNNVRVLQFSCCQGLRCDRDFMANLVEHNPSALEWASSAIRDDREIIFEAVRKGATLEFASERLRGDEEIVREALKNRYDAFFFADKGLQCDRDFVIEGLKVGANMLGAASETFQSDKDVVLLAARYARNCDAVDNLTWLFSKAGITDPHHFQQAGLSPIGIPGEDAPILTVALSHVLDDTKSDRRESGTAAKKFLGEASLLSGATFLCEVPDEGSADQQRPGPILNDLATVLVEALPKHTQIQNAESIFINFRMNEDGDAMPVSPWDWSRPLTDFLPSSPSFHLSTSQ